MATETFQRIYRAPCPGCGAPVEFRSASSLYAVCSYCKSTVVREGEVLSRVGKMAEVFEDHSPLQLMASGRWQGRAFTLVGRLQYRGPSGPWAEWIALTDDGTPHFLAEDNGSYVFTSPAEAGRALPLFTSSFRVGANTAIAGKTYEVTSNEEVALVSAQGELPKLPPMNQPFAMIEMRSADGEVLAIDYGSVPPQLTRGRAVALDELQITGLREEVAAEQKGRQFACPNCGAPVEVHLDASKSITCGSCHSVIDLAAGLGGELHHVEQEEAFEPFIPLGSMGQLQGAQWQVVGYQHRLGHDPQDEDEEKFGWDEYLLFNRKRGFIFLVDTSEGWSIVKPTTGAPAYKDGASSASYLGATYQLKYSYSAETTYVAGEFYWPVMRGQKSFNRDFQKGRNLLSLEETPRERTWSAGSMVTSDLVGAAFNIKDKMAGRGDAGPLSGGAGGVKGGMGCFSIFLMLFIILILIALLRACEGGSGSSGYRTGGGSFGGYSSGGSHK
ncbi:MAG TPA: DUF4178 domain-containing protein [Ramlibacter sp.]|uniref:DUF4178 domain-containing protein n=1 Tax=Ramlibacter sp. TaxID=1917967 RepID=UPI002CA6FC08|nr:DUF4178 domain-containing protein [Ramlibacter sp.]HVZ46969.1 DUF4178 domain-containing protein [Ramlibacter sp.]